jgi:hypothetical protein
MQRETFDLKASEDFLKKLSRQFSSLRAFATRKLIEISDTAGETLFQQIPLDNKTEDCFRLPPKACLILHLRRLAPSSSRFPLAHGKLIVYLCPGR